MNYPKGIKNNTNYLKNNITYGNRGMGLESELNSTNEYYLEKNVAIIYKKPTPITISKVDYKSRSDAVIKEAHFRTPSTTDYNGVYKSRYIDFEAKETNSSTSFPLSNIHDHQILHLKRIIEHGGIGFLIVRFNKLDKTFYLDGNDLLAFLNDFERKSIPLEYFLDKGYLIKNKFRPLVDYLEIVDLIYFKEEK